MAFVWGVLAVTAALFLLSLIYRLARRRREYLVLAFTDRIGIPVTASIIDVVDRRIRDRFFGFALGGLVALLGFGIVILIDPLFVPTGLAGFASGGVLVAAMAAGGAVSALRQFAVPRDSDSSRVARLDAPSITDYVHPAWAWTAAIGFIVAATLTAVLLAGNARGNAEPGGLPVTGVVVLAAISTVGLVCATFLSWRLLEIPQPARDELELQWDDALRAYALRDIWVASIGLSVATIVAACSWILDTSSSVYYAALLVGIAPMMLFAFRPSRRSNGRLWLPVPTAM